MAWSRVETELCMRQEQCGQRQVWANGGKETEARRRGAGNPPLTPQPSPSDTLLSCLPHSTASPKIGLLTPPLPPQSHPLLNPLWSVLLRQPIYMLAKQRDILLSYYLASQQYPDEQYPDVKSSFLGLSLFLILVPSHFFAFFKLLLQCLLLDPPLPLPLQRVSKIMHEKCLEWFMVNSKHSINGTYYYF